MLPIFDVILLVLLGGYVMFGAWFGFIHTLGSLAGAFLGALVASHVFLPLGSWLSDIFGRPELMKVISFLFIFLLVSRLVGFAFYLLDKTFQILTRLPYLRSADRLLGAVTGLFEGFLVIGLGLYVISRYDLGPWFTNVLQGSQLATWFIGVALILQPLLPKALKELKSIFGIGY